MDPEENLREQRRRAARILELMDRECINENEECARNAAIADEANRLAELVQALDEWLKKGGFIPKEWDHSVRQSVSIKIKPVVYCEKYEITRSTVVDALGLTREELAAADYPTDVMKLCEAGYSHGLQGWYQDSAYASDADWANGIGVQIRELEEQLGCESGEVMDFYMEAHTRGLADGGHVSEEDEG